MLISLLFHIYSSYQNGINDILNKPISFKSAEGNDNFLNYNVTKNRLKFSKIHGKFDLTTNFIIMKDEDCFKISVGDKFLNVSDRFFSLGLVDNEEESTYFDIVPFNSGFKIIYNNKCMTKEKNKCIMFKECFKPDSVYINRQFFELKEKRNSFFGNFHDLICEDENEISEEFSSSSFDLEKKFRESVYDKPFVESMKYFYDFAKNEQEKELKNCNLDKKKDAYSDCQINCPVN